MSLRTAEHVLITSYDSEGRGRTSLEQIVPVEDGRVGFWLPNDEGVRERFPDGCVVSVRAATNRGRPLVEEPVQEGRAQVIAEGEVFDRVKAAIAAKYPQPWLGSVMGRAKEALGGRTPECVVLIALLG